MKAAEFTDAQKAFVIKQGEEGTSVAEICRKAGISQATYFNWRESNPAGVAERRFVFEDDAPPPHVEADYSIVFLRPGFAGA